MSGLIRDKKLDSSLDLLREGNRFILNRCKAYSTNIFSCRLMLKKTVCVSGAEAAQMFYEKGHMTRQGAIPRSVLRLLQDKGSVATLNDTAHQQRKALFISILNVESISRLEESVAERTASALRNQNNTQRFSLLHKMELILNHSCTYKTITTLLWY